LSSKLPKIKIDIRNQLEFIKESLDEIEEELQAQLVEFKERVEE
jgi:tetrahydromethanopterin S-methyltransferase subunit G